MSGEHSEFSPSSLGDKLLCPARHKATLGKGGGSSPAADRGTECHEWAEKLFSDPDAPVPAFKEDWQEECTREMVQMAWDQLQSLPNFADVPCSVETKVNLGHLSHFGFPTEKVWGTADLMMYSQEEKTLVVLDYKSGKGIDVDVFENVQMMVYGLGGIGVYDEAEKVRLVIAQPRTHSQPKIWEITVPELLTWAEGVLVPGLRSMTGIEPQYIPGKKQCQWCAVKGKCPAQRRELLDMIERVPQPDNTLDNYALDALLKRTREIRQWADQVEAIAMERMTSGEKIPGFKIVRGRSNRAWINPDKAAKWLCRHLTKAKAYKHKLISPTQAETDLKEKLQKSTRLKTSLELLVFKPPGKYTYAPREDPREEVLFDAESLLASLDEKQATKVESIDDLL